MVLSTGKQALLLAGNWNLMRYAIRQDITYKILTEASLTDDSGKVLLNLAQQDCCAIRPSCALAGRCRSR